VARRRLARKPKLRMRTKPGYDTSRSPHIFTVPAASKLSGRENISRLQFLSSIVHGMFANREASPGVIGD
jgi:hypothetical protein